MICYDGNRATMCVLNKGHVLVKFSDLNTKFGRTMCVIGESK